MQLSRHLSLRLPSQRVALRIVIGVTLMTMLRNWTMEYIFTLKYQLLGDGCAMDELVERLGEAVCDDALVVNVAKEGRRLPGLASEELQAWFG
jgi:hypothetical protein